MLGKNKISRPIVNYDGSFFVCSIFYTIQGEGVFAGRPAVFIRLQGCNLQCSFCDTEFDDGIRMSINDIINQVKEESGGNADFVVITGGEPFLQPIQHLCKSLLAAGFDVQIETNGTLWRPIPKLVHITCSPKFTKGTSLSTLHPTLLKKKPILKFIISVHNSLYRNVPSLYSDYDRGKIYVQPMDEMNEQKNDANLRHTIDLAMKYGYRISLQLHKIMNIE